MGTHHRSNMTILRGLSLIFAVTLLSHAFASIDDQIVPEMDDASTTFTSPSDELQDMINEVDADGSGTIDFPERRKPDGNHVMTNLGELSQTQTSTTSTSPSDELSQTQASTSSCTDSADLLDNSCRYPNVDLNGDGSCCEPSNWRNHWSKSRRCSWKAAFQKGEYRSLTNGAKNDEATWIRVPECCKVTLYEHGNFGGWSEEFTYKNQGAIRHNDQVSSLKVEDGPCRPVGNRWSLFG